MSSEMLLNAASSMKIGIRQLVNTPCYVYQDIRKKSSDDVSLKYPNFNTLNNSDKVLFLFTNIDPFICKKLGYFTFEAFQKRKQ